MSGSVGSASAEVACFLVVLLYWSGTADAASVLSPEHNEDTQNTAARKFLQGVLSPSAAEKNPERLIPSGPSDPRQYQNTISEACRRAFDLIAAPPVEPEREVPRGSEDPHLYQRLKDCWKAMRPHYASYNGKPKLKRDHVADRVTSESMNIQPERQVPTGPDPVHHRSIPQH